MKRAKRKPRILWAVEVDWAGTGPWLYPGNLRRLGRSDVALYRKRMRKCPTEIRSVRLIEFREVLK